MFLRFLDDMQTAKERKAARTNSPVEDPIYTEGTQHLRWSHFVNEFPQQMLSTLRDGVFPWLHAQYWEEFAFYRDARDVRFTISTPSLLARVVDMLSEIPLNEWEIWGDFYEYMLSKIAVAGRYGQFRTPRHIVQLIIEMMAPGPADEICDPTCGTAGFLVAAAEYVNRAHIKPLAESIQYRNGNGRIFHGFDFDRTMLRIASMNMLVHGIEKPDIRYRDLLAEGTVGEAERYSMILADPPFAGSLDYEATARELLAIVKTHKTELLFIALFLRLLKTGGRAAVIVPEGALFGPTAAHKKIRRTLVEDQKLEAVVKLPSAVFKPYTGVSTSILFFTKTNSGGTDYVWFYEVIADGWSLDDKRKNLLADDKLGPAPRSVLSETDLARNNLPDVLARWTRRDASERRRRRTEQSFCVSKSDIAAQDYDLSLNCYRRLGEMEKTLRVEGWRLGDFAKVLAGGVGSTEIDKTPMPDFADKQQRVLHPSFLMSPLPNVKDLPIRTNSREPKYRLRQGDVVGRDLASNRYWTVLPDEYEGVQAGQGILVIRLTREVIPVEYLAAYLSSPQAERDFPRYGVIPRIRRADLENITIPACEGDFESIRAAISRLEEGAYEADRVQRALRESRISIFEAATKHERRIQLEQAGDFSSLIAQNLRKQNEPYKVFQEAYPYGTARAVRKFKHSTTLAEKHEAVIQCSESLILSLGILSLAFAAHAGRQNLAEIAEWVESVRHGGPSLGHWVKVIKAVGADARESGDRAAGLAEATVLKKGGKGLTADLGALVTLRNKIRHGAGPRTRAEIEKSLERLEHLVFSSLSSSAFLARSQWVHIDRLRWLPEVGRHQVSGLSLMGDHPDFEPVDFETDRPLADNSLYVFTQQGEIVPLSPFCILSDCPACLAPELYYPDRLTSSTAQLKSLDRGHELESDMIFKQLSPNT